MSPCSVAPAGLLGWCRMCCLSNHVQQPCLKEVLLWFNNVVEEVASQENVKEGCFKCLNKWRMLLFVLRRLYRSLHLSCHLSLSSKSSVTHPTSFPLFHLTSTCPHTHTHTHTHTHPTSQSVWSKVWWFFDWQPLRPTHAKTHTHTHRGPELSVRKRCRSPCVGNCCPLVLMVMKWSHYLWFLFDFMCSRE